MSAGTGIEWAHDSLNPWTGCERISPGCANCYAASMARRFTPGAAAWDGTIVRNSALKIDKHLRLLENAKTARRVFLGSMTDLGLVAREDPDGLADILSRVYRVQWSRGHHKPIPRPLHAFIILTKRPVALRRFMERLTWDAMTQTLRVRTRAEQPGWPEGQAIPGLWIGVTAENNEQAMKRIPELMAIPMADKRIVSLEPLVGPVNIRPWASRLDWVILGGETGGRAVRTRPMHPVWTEDAERAATEAGVPFFFKSWGDWTPEKADNGKRDGTQGAWLGTAPHQFLACTGVGGPPEGYPLVAKRPQTEQEPHGKPQQVPDFPSEGAI